MSKTKLASRPHSVPYLETDPPGVNIYRLRIARGWSQGDLAKACKPPVDTSTISKIERNKGFTLTSLKAVADALGVPYQTLFYPPELHAYGTLPPDVRQRLADTINDVAAAYQATPAARRRR